MESKLNNLPPVSDFDSAYMLAQQAHENGFRGSTFLELWIWIKQRLDLIGLDNTAGLPEEFPTPGSTLVADSKGQWTVLTAGIYNKMTSGTIVIDENQFAFAQYDGVDYNNVRIVDLPNNAARVPNWEPGTHDKDEIVTVDGVIYRATESTNEEPPSDKWEAIGGSGSGVDLDVSGGALSYDSFVDNRIIRINPTFIRIEGDRWNDGEVINTTTGTVTSGANASRLGKILLKRGFTVKANLKSSSSQLNILLYDLDGTFQGSAGRTEAGSGDVVMTAIKDCYIDMYSANNIGDFYVDIELESFPNGALAKELNDISSVHDRLINANTGALQNSAEWDASELIRLKVGDIIEGVAYSNGVRPVIYLYGSDKSFSGVINTEFDLDGKANVFYEALENCYIRINNYVKYRSEWGIKVYYQGGDILIKTSEYNRNSFVRNKVSYDTNSGASVYNEDVKSTLFISLLAGEELTASLYNGGNSTVNNVFQKTLFDVPIGSLALPNTEGVPNIWSLKPSRDISVGLNTRTDFGNDYWFKIKHLDRYVIPLYSTGKDPENYINGKPYYGGEVVKDKGYFYKANKLTFDSPHNSKDWELIGYSNNLPSDDSIVLGIPETIAEVNVIGALPTDSSAVRTNVYANIEFIVNGVVQLSALASINVQGDSSAQHPKKGYNIVLYNENLEELEVQFSGSDFNGDPIVWPQNDSFHLKGFWTDELMTRDVAGNRLWRQIFMSREFPESWFSGLDIPVDGDGKAEMYEYRSRFITDGFPIVLNVNGEFHGLYVWRQKKDRKNYRFIKDNKKHVWLEALGNSSMTTFNPAQWELRNPKLSGYNEGGSIEDNEVMEEIDRFWSWVKDCHDGVVDFNDTYQNYMDLGSFINYIIFTELLYNRDGVEKNFHIMTYGDGIWKVNPYDLDLTLTYSNSIAPDLEIDKRVFTQGGFTNTLFNMVYDNKLDELKQAYKNLKDLKIIELNNLFQVYRKIPTQIGPDLLKQNFDKWESMPFVTHGEHRSSMQWIMTYFKNRIEYLDGLWL